MQVSTKPKKIMGVDFDQVQYESNTYILGKRYH